jgi:hypothetical protein
LNTALDVKNPGFFFVVKYHTMKVMCETLFDCSATGVTGSFRASQIPFRDRHGQAVNNIDDWNRSRNQQRNLETILQVIGLRTQPEELSAPQCVQGMWQFTFEVANEDAFLIAGNTDPHAALYRDCAGVPMVTNLLESKTTQPMLCTSGADQNIWFRAINN